ncbi:MAG TPA: SDR family NAD(P)-dependent oxidoreductase, partial [Pseudonocardiaceae bacterium]
AAGPAGPLPLDDWFAVPTWRQLPPARPSSESSESGLSGLPGACLVIAAGPRGEMVAQALRDAGVSVTVRGPGSPGAVSTQSKASADPVSTQSWIVHCAALDGDPAGGRVDAAVAAQDGGFLDLLALVRELAADDPGAVRLDVLSAGTVAVVGGDLTRPEHATLDGIARVLPLELPWLTVRRVDLPDVPAAGNGGTAAVLGVDGARLVAELAAADAPELVALRGGRRWTREFEQVRATATDAGLREGGRYLVTGGLGGIGITVAEDLANRVRARLVLTARTGLPPRADWDTHLAVHGDSGRTGRAIAAVRRMEAAGATVHVVAADVTDAEGLRRVRALVDAELGGLDGIVHAAGIAGGGMAELKDRDTAAAVLAPKVAGTLELRAAFGDLDLDWVALCASVTGIAGGFGQVDYCAGNAFLDAHASGDHGWRGRVVSLDWGGWRDVGMVVETGRAQPAEPVREAAVDHPLLTDRGPSGAWGVVSAGTHWLLDEHRIDGVGVVPGTGHLEAVRAAVTACRPGPAGSVLELRDVAFTEPLAVPDGAAARYAVELDGAAFTVTGTRGGVRTAHAAGQASWVPADAPAPVDVAALRDRMRPVHDAADDVFREGGRTSLLTFGPRWGVLRESYSGRDEELALLAGGDPGEGWGLHPALLDVATSFGSRGEGSYLPLGYGRVVVHHPLPGRFWSHLRHRGGGTDVLTADLTLIAEDGTVLVTVEEYVLRQVTAPPVGAEPRAATATDRTEAPDARGIAPADGVEALLRMVGTDLGPQVVVNPETVEQLFARARRTTTEAVADDAPDTGEPVTAEVAADEELTGLEATLAAVWREILGVDRVGADDDFFALGGNSLVAVQLVAQVRKAVGVRLPMRSLFETPTVRGLAARVEQLRGEAAAAAPPAAAVTVPRLDRGRG